MLDQRRKGRKGWGRARGERASNSRAAGKNVWQSKHGHMVPARGSLHLGESVLD
jgi:hypothetical protein